MKKTRLIFYWAILVLSMFLYYEIGINLYSTSQIDLNGGAMVGVELTAIFVVPLNFILGFVRLWLLKSVSQRSRILDIPYFVLPVLIIITSFAEQLWAGITLSTLAGGLIAYEFIRSIIKSDSWLLRKG